MYKKNVAGVANLGKLFQTHEEQENQQEQSAWIHQEKVMLNQFPNLL